MTVEQTVEIPPSRRLFIDVPAEVPVGKTILTFTTVPADEALEYAQRIWLHNHANPEELEAKLNKLRGCLGESAFGGLDGVAYQHKVRQEWDD